MPPSEVTLTTDQLNWLVHSLMLARISLTADSRTKKDALLAKVRQARQALSKAETFINNKYLGKTTNTGQFND